MALSTTARTQIFGASLGLGVLIITSIIDGMIGLNLHDYFSWWQVVIHKMLLFLFGMVCGLLIADRVQKLKSKG